MLGGRNERPDVVSMKTGLSSKVASATRATTIEPMILATDVRLCTLVTSTKPISMRVMSISFGCRVAMVKAAALHSTDSNGPTKSDEMTGGVSQRGDCVATGMRRWPPGPFTQMIEGPRMV